MVMSEKPNPALEDWDPDPDLEGSFADDLPEEDRRKLLGDEEVEPDPGPRGLIR